MKDRLFELTGPEADNNAFIMCMDDTIDVEFSKHGNTAYQYRRHQLPLDISHRSISIGELKHDKAGQIRHSAAQRLTWEERFAQALGSGQHQTRPPSVSPLSAPAVSAVGILTFARKLGIDVEDHRSKGGSLWLLADDSNNQVADQLTTWGFKYRTGKGWCRSQ